MVSVRQASIARTARAWSALGWWRSRWASPWRRSSVATSSLAVSGAVHTAGPPGSVVQPVQPVERRDRGHQARLAQVEVAERGLDAAVPEQALDGVGVGAGLEHVGGEGVPEAVQAAGLGDARLGLGRVEAAVGGGAG